MLPFFLKGLLHMSWLLGAILIFTIALIAGATRSSVPNLWIQRFKFLFPSWRFFEQVGNRHTLFIQTPTTNEWVHLSLKVQRRPWMILYNPQGNLRLAMDSLLEQLMQDLADLQNSLGWEQLSPTQQETQIHQLTSYQLVEQLALHLCEAQGMPAKNLTTFKISSYTQGQKLSGQSLDDAFIFQASSGLV